MKPKILFTIVCVLLLVLTMSSALAEEIGSWGITPENQWWLQGVADTSGYLVNWSDLGQDDNMPLVYDLDFDGNNEIIHERNDVIKIYDLNGSVLAIQSIPGIENRGISAFGSHTCPHSRALYVMNQTTIQEWCFNGTGLTQVSTYTTPFSIPNYQIMSMASVNGSVTGIIGTGFNVLIRNFNSYSNINISVGKSISATGTKAPYGNFRIDGKMYWAFTTFVSYAGEKGFMIIEPGGTNYYVGLSNVSGLSYSNIMAVKRGSGNPDEILLKWGTTSSFGYWYGDSYGYAYKTNWYLTNFSIYRSISNPMQLGTNGDICFFANDDAKNIFACLDPSSLTYTANATINATDSKSLSGFSGKDVMATDMDGDGYSDFLLPQVSGNYSGSVTNKALLCPFSGSGDLDCEIIGDASDYALALDIDSDTYRDIILSDSANDMLRVFRTAGSTPPPPPGNITCNDTDYAGSYPTFNSLVQGTISGTNITNTTDSCYNSTHLIEQACLNSSTALSPAYINCYADYSGGSCSAGACVEGNLSFCSDTDYNGTYISDDPFVRGIRSGTGLNTSEDYCASGTLLYEYSCINSSVGNPIPEAINCTQYGMECSAGVCIAPTTQTCTDSDSSSPNPYIILGNITIKVNNITQYSVEDNCYNTSILRERYCVNSSSYSVMLYDCSAIDGVCLNGICDISGCEGCGELGGTCIDGECYFENVTGACSDSDSETYPTIDYYEQGIMRMVGIQSQTDYCYGDFVVEYYCDNATNDHPYGDMFDCTSVGMVCVNGSCVSAGINGTCVDSDKATYPSLNETTFGEVSITINNVTTNYSDYCSGNTLTEYYCTHPDLPIASNTTYTCYIYGMDCVGGQCVARVNQTCEDLDKAYADPKVVASSVLLKVDGVVTQALNDTCYNSTILREYYCRDNETSGTEAFDCAISSGTCSNGRCVYPNEDIGVSQDDLRWCWSETNGSFNWDCCTESENQTKTFLCPLRVTFKYGLGSIATFVFNNFIYFLILIIIFVLLAPFIAPKLRGNQ